MHKKLVSTIAAVAATLGVVAAANAQSGEVLNSATIHFAAGAFKINPQTCKFAKAEVDKPLGQTWAVGRVWSVYEDGRHDVKMNCNTQRQTAVIRCFAKPLPPVAERVDHKGGWADEKGAAAAVAAVQKIQACVVGVGGLSIPPVASQP